MNWRWQALSGQYTRKTRSDEPVHQLLVRQVQAASEVLARRRPGISSASLAAANLGSGEGGSPGQLVSS